MNRRRKGQSILEYVIILTAIVLVIIAAATGVMKPSVEKTMDNAGKVVDHAAEKLLEGTGAGG